MALTYDPIATTTLGANANSVTFSNIPQTYTDLIVIINAGTTYNTSADAYQIDLNATGNNFSVTRLYGNGSSASSDRFTTPYAGWISTTLGGSDQVHIMNYANTTTFKTVLTRSSSQGSYPIVGATVTLWRYTNAITSVKLIDTSGNFLSGSSFTLYGIKAV